MSQSLESVTAHPTTAMLDRWRAGLLEESPAQRDAIVAHVHDCAVCQQQIGLWSQTVETLEHGTKDAATTSRLRARRHRALRGMTPPPSRRIRPLLALAAAVTAIAIGIGAFLYMGQRTGENAVVATNESGDFYADIDFYLWLLEKQAHPDAPPNG